MPNIGDIALGRDIGRADYTGRHIFLACNSCGKERWVRLCRYKRGLHTRCRKCEAQLSRFGRKQEGGRIMRRGYVLIRLQPDDFFYPMATKAGYVFEHRLMMAKHLERLLLRQEVIHHKNGIKNDNRIENLKLFPNTSKHLEMNVCSRCELRREIRLLRWQLKELLGDPQRKLL